MTTTPRTDAAFEGDLSVGIPPEIKTWEEAKKFARQLETELIALQEENEENRKTIDRLHNLCVSAESRAVSKYKEERDQLLATVEGLKHAGELLWTVIANVNEGNWDKQSYDWRVAAARWRDNYFNTIKSIPPTNLVKRSVLEKLVKEASNQDNADYGEALDVAIKEAQEELERTSKK